MSETRTSIARYVQAFFITDKKLACIASEMDSWAHQPLGSSGILGAIEFFGQLIGRGRQL